MKKIFITLVLFVFSFTLTSCKKKSPKIIESDELTFSVEIDYADNCFIMDYDFGKESLDITEAGFIYVINYDKEDKLVFETENVLFRLIDMSKDHKRCSITFSSAKEKIVNYTFRGYIKKTNGTIIYSNQQETVNIDSRKIIFSVDIKYAVKDNVYLVTSSNPDYDVKLTNSSDYNYIYFTVTAKNSLVFLSYLNVFINDKQISKSDYTIEDNILNIKIKDPNWGDIF